MKKFSLLLSLALVSPLLLCAGEPSFSYSYIQDGVRTPGSQLEFHLALPSWMSTAAKKIVADGASAAVAEWNKNLLNLSIVLGEPVSSPSLGNGINEIFVVPTGTQYAGHTVGVGNSALCFFANSGEADIVLASSFVTDPVSATGRILHEMGHAIGLRHSLDFLDFTPGEQPQSIMGGHIPTFHDMPMNENGTELQAFDIVYAGTLYGIKPNIAVPPMFSDSLTCYLRSVFRRIPGVDKNLSVPSTTTESSFQLALFGEWSRRAEWRIDGAAAWNTVQNDDFTYSQGYKNYLLDVPLLEGTHTYEFRLANNRAVSETMSFTIARTKIAPDTTPPTLTLAALPKEGSTVSSPATQIFTGNILDYGTDFRVDYSLNGGAWVLGVGTVEILVPGVENKSRTTCKWNAPINLQAGRNTLSFRAVDAAGNASPVVSRSITFLVPTSITVNAGTGGTLTKGYEGVTTRTIGTTYKITATPKTGMIFKEWLLNNVSFSRNATLTFVAQPGMTFTPVFIPNPFPALAGTYVGLFGDGDVSVPAFSTHNGILWLTTGVKGQYSGYVLIAGVRRSFSGTFDGFGQANFVIKTSKLPDVAVSITLGTSATGTVNGIAFEAHTNKQDLTTAKKHPLAGKTFDGSLLPETGNGSLWKMTVSSTGGATVSGKTPDGKTFSITTLVLKGTEEWVVPICGLAANKTFWGETSINANFNVAGELGISELSITKILQMSGNLTLPKSTARLIASVTILPHWSGILDLNQLTTQAAGPVVR